MASVSSWISHFRQMGQDKLPPNSIQVVRGSGVARTFYRVSPTQQAIDQARVTVDSTGRRKRPGKTQKRPIKRKRKSPIKRKSPARRKIKRKPKNKSPTRRKSPTKRKTPSKDIFSKK